MSLSSGRLALDRTDQGLGFNLISFGAPHWPLLAITSTKQSFAIQDEKTIDTATNQLHA